VKTLVIGGGGLIGSSLRKAFFREFGYYQQPHAVPWENIEDAVSVLRRNVKDFLAECGMEAWVIAWCAGRGGFSSTTAELASEHVYLNCVLDELAQSRNNNGVFFFASSAGAIYTESGSQVFTEKSPTSVSNDYGIHKLEQEGVVSQFAQRTKTKCVIGRLVSIYGPNQNLEKPQGLISRLCLNSKMNVSTDIYVYNLVIEYDCYSTVKIFCSHESVSISTVCKALSNVTKKKTLIKAHLSAGLPKYPEHFNIASTTNPDLGKFCQTTLVSGIGQVFKKIQL
jgi:nucleoside-diphosphate-sugar epimerase